MIAQKAFGRSLTAFFSLLIGLASVSLLVLAILSLPPRAAGEDSASSLSIPVTGSVALPSGIGLSLAGSSVGFLLGLAGVIAGCSCLPENRAELHARLRSWLAGSAIVLGALAMLSLLGVTTYLSAFTLIH